MIKTLYLNLEDDIPKITSKLKREASPEVVLVFPRKSFLFSDSINLRLLKKQTDLLGKKIYILTMDEVGQMYAKEAGFQLKFLPKSGGVRGVADIRPRGSMPRPAPVVPPRPPVNSSALTGTPKLTEKVAMPAAPVPLAPSAPTLHQATPQAIQALDDIPTVPPLEKPQRERSRRSSRAILMSFIALCLIVAVALFTIVLPSADIVVYAKSQPVSRDIDLTADTKVTNSDASQLKLPAFAVDETVETTQTFQTVGKKEVGSKAQGRVAIYNLTGSPMNLRATTTVLSVGSKNYTFNEDQNNIRALPGPTQDSGATVADITAQAGGESYNLPAGTRLEITNQSFGSQPQRLYAKTVTQVIGGSSRFVSVIGADDIKKAQTDLNVVAADNIRNDLKSRNLVLIDEAFTATSLEFSTDKPEGTEAPSFSGRTKVRIVGLAFNQEELIKLLRERLTMSLADNKSLQDVGQDAITYRVRNLDTVNGTLSLSIHYESKILPNLDSAEVRQRIAGKSREEASEVLLSNPDVDRVDIKLAPSWQSTIPRFAGKIDIRVEK
jgi:hypothetical protein